MIEPSQGVLDVIRRREAPPGRCKSICPRHDLGIDAVLEKKGASTGLITTKGFHDVIEIARMDRPDMYNILYEKPATLGSPASPHGGR